MAANVAQIVVKANTAQADKGIKGLTGRMGGLKTAAIGVGIAAGAAAVGGIAAFAKSSISAFAQAGDEVQKMSLRVGFSTEALSELKHAAELSGTSLGSLENGVKRMQRTILDAENGLSTAVDAFEMLGVEMADVEGKTPEEQFTLLSNALADVEDASRRSALAQQVFGRAGTQLLPMLAAGKDGLAAMRQEAHDLGMVFDQQSADSAAEYNDALTKLSGAFNGIKFAVGKALIPVLIPLIEKLTHLATISQKYVAPTMKVLGITFKILFEVAKAAFNIWKSYISIYVNLGKALFDLVMKIDPVRKAFERLSDMIRRWSENWTATFNSAISTVERWINIVVDAFNQLVGMMPDFIKGKLGIEEMSEITLPRLEVVTGETKVSVEELNVAAVELGTAMDVANEAIVQDIAAIDDLAEITSTAVNVEHKLADAREQSMATVHDLIALQESLDKKQKESALRQMADANTQLARAGVTGQMFNKAGELVNIPKPDRTEGLMAHGISFGGTRQFFEKDAAGNRIAKEATAYNQRFTGQQLIDIGVIKVEAGIWTTDEAALGDAIGEAIIKASKRSGPVLTKGTMQD